MWTELMTLRDGVAPGFSSGGRTRSGHAADVLGLRRFTGDRSGAIALVGVFMATFLVGLVFYIMGVGDACLYREMAQDGADATAYSAAVADARGMNIIAFINIIMAILLAILIAAKIFQLLFMVVNSVSCAMAFASIFCPECLLEWSVPVCDWTSQKEPTVQKWVSKLADFVTKTDTALHTAWGVVAVADPYLAEIKSVVVASTWRVTTPGSPLITGGTVAISMIPGALLPALPGADNFGQSGQSGGGSGQPPQSTISKVASKLSPGTNEQTVRYGLPVANNTFSSLCVWSSSLLNDLIWTPLDGQPWLTPVKGFFGLVLDGFMQWAPEFFCGNGMANSEGFSNAAQAECQDWAKNPQKTNKARATCIANAAGDQTKLASCPPQVPTTGTAKWASGECQTNQTKVLQNTASNKAVGEAQKGEQPAVVYPPAVANSDYLTVLSMVATDPSMPGEQGVVLPTWGNDTLGPVELWNDMSFAKAEFYYDKGEDESSSQLCDSLGNFFFNALPDLVGVANLGSGFPPDAMYNMRWRARMIRFRIPTVDVLNIVSNNFNQGLKTYLKDQGGLKKLNNLPGFLAEGNKKGIYNLLAASGIFGGIRNATNGWANAGTNLINSQLGDALTLDGTIIH